MSPLYHFIAGIVIGVTGTLVWIWLGSRSASMFFDDEAEEFDRDIERFRRAQDGKRRPWTDDELRRVGLEIGATEAEIAEAQRILRQRERHSGAAL